MQYVKDETYWIISNEAYDLNIVPNTYRNDHIPGWKAVNLDEKLLHDTNGSGFDATVFHNEKTNQVIIGYRGTEPPDRPKWSVAMDWGTDVNDVVGGREKTLSQIHDYYVNNLEEVKTFPPQVQSSFQQYEAQYQNNQFTHAQNLYDEVKKKYPFAEISTTGHSLGGAEAEYVAVRNELSSVSFNAPGIVHLLPEDLQTRVEAGEFKKTNVAFAHPGDTIGGGETSANRHVGETYYIGKNYNTANVAKVTIPVSIPMERKNEWERLIFGPKWSPTVYVPVTLPMMQQDAFTKFYNSLLGGEHTHRMAHFTFDKNGNITNPLYTIDGQLVKFNPRLQAYEQRLAAEADFKEVMGDLVEHYGGQMGSFGQLAATALRVNIIGEGQQSGRSNGGAYLGGQKNGGTIQLTTGELKHAANQMRSSLHGFSSDTRASIQSFQAHIGTSESRYLTPIAHSATAALDRINRWYQESITEIAEYIDRKGQEFTMIDQ
ncbi:lipase family protein [Paenibacillus sp. NPDC055715]